MTFETIDVAVADGVMTLALNRPDKLNAFNRTVMAELIAAFDRAEADDDVRAVIVTGAGIGGRDTADDVAHAGRGAPDGGAAHRQPRHRLARRVGRRQGRRDGLSRKAPGAVQQPGFERHAAVLSQVAGYEL